MLLNPFAASGIRTQGWSIYGAERTQPAAIGGESDGRENGPNKPNSLPLIALVRRGPRFESGRGLELHRRFLRRTQVGEDGEDSAVAVLALGQVELRENVAHVRLDRAFAQVEALGDAHIR